MGRRRAWAKNPEVEVAFAPYETRPERLDATVSSLS